VRDFDPIRNRAQQFEISVLLCDEKLVWMRHILIAFMTFWPILLAIHFEGCWQKCEKIQGLELTFGNWLRNRLDRLFCGIVERQKWYIAPWLAIPPEGAHQ
jgi:hypothetical protein